MKKKSNYPEQTEEAVLGFGRVIRYVSENTGMFGGWGPKSRL